jgi:DNA-binding MarR family transcriptional regulator
MRTANEGAREMVMRATGALVGIAAQSLAAVGGDVSLPQFRVLVLLGDAPRTMGELAESLAVNPSTVTRVCDVLVGKGLIQRLEAAGNRRVVRAELTRAGRRLVAHALTRRRALVDEALGRMTPHGRQRLARSLAEFAGAAGEISDHAWTLGWSPEGTEANNGTT